MRLGTHGGNLIIKHPHVIGSLGGHWWVAGSRVSVVSLYKLYKSGLAIDRIVKRYPQLSTAKVFDAISFGIDNSELFP